MVIILLARGKGGADDTDRQSRRNADQNSAEQVAVPEGAKLLSGTEAYSFTSGVVTLSGNRPRLADDRADQAIVDVLESAASSFAQATDAEAGEQTINFAAKDFVSGDFTNIVVTYNGQANPAADALVFQAGKGQVTLSNIMNGGYEEPLSNYVRGQLKTRFPSAPEGVAEELSTADALESSFRVADNGLVAIVPLEKLTGASGVHEVLVPLSVLEAYKAY